MIINSLLIRFISIVIAITVPAFGSAAQNQAQPPGHSGKQPPAVAAEEAGPVSALTPDVIYNILVGEIALQRRNLGMAYEYQLKGAEMARDAVAAERAARIAMHQKDQAKALVAVRLWMRYAPENERARQMAVMLSIQAGKSEEALQHLRKLVLLREAQGLDGFVHAVAAVTSGQDKAMALNLMQSLAADYPEDPQANYAVGLAAVMAGQLDVAEREVRHAIGSKPGMERAHVLLGRIYMERKDGDGAMRTMQQALETSPKSTVLRSAYARLLVDLDKPELAFEQFQELWALIPDDADVQFSLGILALQLDRRTQAAEFFRGLVEAKKRAADASFYLGRIDEMEGRMDAAIGWYKKVRDGSYVFDAQSRTAGLVAAKGDVSGARAMLEAMRGRMPQRSVDLYILEGEILRKHSSNDKVVELYSAALKLHPEDLDLLYARALSASVEGRLDMLEQDIMEILKRNPDHADAMNALGYTLADQTDRYQEAFDYIQKALILKPDSPAILDSMGWIQYRLGNNEEALRYLRRAFEKLQDAEIATHLMELLWVTGQKQEAQKILQDALKKNPHNKYLQQAIRRLGI
jgi:tetratricopeptide (TPR) repeat protein